MYDIEYKYNTSDVHAIFEHLKLNGLKYYPSIQNISDLKLYAQKISDRADRFELWDQNLLVGMVATYLNDYESKIGFITNVSIFKEYRRMGYAKLLIEECLKYARSINFIELRLSVNKLNPAIKLYNTMKFKVIQEEAEYSIMSIDLKK